MQRAVEETLLSIVVGLVFCAAFMGLAAIASEMGDPWGLFVLLALLPGMPFLGNRGDPHWPALAACAVAWTTVGAVAWAAHRSTHPGPQSPKPPALTTGQVSDSRALRIARI